MLEYMNSLAGVYKDYDNYVKMVEAEGKKPVSLIRYAFDTRSRVKSPITQTALPTAGSKSETEKEEVTMMNYYYTDPIAEMYMNYDKYARSAEAEGKKPVSLLKFAMGNF